MSVTRNVEAMPVRMLHILQALPRTDASISRADLEILFLPGDKVKREGSSLFTSTLNELKNLEFIIEDDDGKLSLSPVLRGEISRGGVDQDMLRGLMEPVLFDPARAEETNNDDFALALCWLLECNPCDAPRFGAEPAELMRPILGDSYDRTGCRNETNFKPFVYWASFMGFAIRYGDRVVPDPSRAIERALPDIFAQTRSHPSQDFFSALSDRYPVFEQGDRRTDFDDLREDGKGGDPTRVTEATSLALARLQGRGLVVLEQKADGAGLVFGAGLGKITAIAAGEELAA